MNSLESVMVKLKQLAPLSLAASWDNVGLLVEPSPPKYISKIMLTNDLTSGVMEEAKDKTVDLIISYHPPIFTPIKRLTQDSWKQRLVVECIENRIALFSPHTSFDAVKDGVNDWLISAFDYKKDTLAPIEVTEEFPDGLTHALEIEIDPSKLKEIRDQVLLSQLPAESRLRKNKEAFKTHPVKVGSTETLKLCVECNKSELTSMMKGLTLNSCLEHLSIKQLMKAPRTTTGFGRKAELSNSISLDAAIEMVKSHLKLQHVSVAKSQSKQTDKIESVAVCAGSGSGVLGSVQADLLLTGEMSHHEVLDAVHRGCNVILCHHSNTERGYLKVVEEKLSKSFGDSMQVFLADSDSDPLIVV